MYLLTEKLRSFRILLGAVVAPLVIFGLGAAFAGPNASSDYGHIVVALAYITGLISLSFIRVSWAWKALIGFLYIPVLGGTVLLVAFTIACGFQNSCP
jgi:hypothetical protein